MPYYSFKSNLFFSIRGWSDTYNKIFPSILDFFNGKNIFLPFVENNETGRQVLWRLMDLMVNFIVPLSVFHYQVFWFKWGKCRNVGCMNSTWSRCRCLSEAMFHVPCLIVRWQWWITRYLILIFICSLSWHMIVHLKGLIVWSCAKKVMSVEWNIFHIFRLIFYHLISRCICICIC